MNDWDRERQENPKTCQLCGETDPTVDMFVGGYIGYAHHKCADISNKGIDLYLRWIAITDNGLIAMAQDVLEADGGFTVVTKPREVED